jgi:para-nitrobenzyl esterase
MGAWAKRRVVTSRNPIYVYQYLHATPGPKMARYGSFHTAEVPYIFQNLSARDRTFTAADLQVSKQISSYVLNFIRTGNPNGDGLTYWPSYNLADEPAIRLDTAASVSRILPIEKRDLFESSFVLGGSIAGR